IVPRTRGAERSRTISEIVSEVRTLVARGVKEVTLLGQIVNLYGRHEFPSVAVAAVYDRRNEILNGESAVIARRYNISPFVQLLEAVSAIEGLERLRFTSPHPIGFRDDLVDAISRLPKLAEHVHLPLQSGSNRILKAMHRPYTAERYAQLVGKIRGARPGIAITTDIIVGFPGETDSDYKMTRDLVSVPATRASCPLASVPSCCSSTNVPLMKNLKSSPLAITRRVFLPPETIALFLVLLMIYV